MSQQTEARLGGNEITGPLVLHVSVGNKILPIDIYTSGHAGGDPEAGLIAWTPYIGLTIADIAPHAMIEDKHYYLGPPTLFTIEGNEGEKRSDSVMSFLLFNSYGQALDGWMEEAKVHRDIWAKQGKNRQWAAENDTTGVSLPLLTPVGSGGGT